MQDSCQAARVEQEHITDNSKYAPKGISPVLVAELASKGLSSPQIGQIVGCDHSNVIRMLQRYGIQTERAKQYQEARADILAGMQDRMLSNITDSDMAKASMLQKVTATGILYDKERLERGLSTSNIDTHVMVREGEEIADRIADLEAELARLVGSTPPDKGDNRG